MVNRIWPIAPAGKADSVSSVSASACQIGGPNSVNPGQILLVYGINLFYDGYLRKNWLISKIFKRLESVVFHPFIKFWKSRFFAQAYIVQLDFSAILSSLCWNDTRKKTFLQFYTGKHKLVNGGKGNDMPWTHVISLITCGLSRIWDGSIFSNAGHSNKYIIMQCHTI